MPIQTVFDDEGFTLEIVAGADLDVIVTFERLDDAGNVLGPFDFSDFDVDANGNYLLYGKIGPADGEPSFFLNADGSGDDAPLLWSMEDAPNGKLRVKWGSLESWRVQDETTVRRGSGDVWGFRNDLRVPISDHHWILNESTSDIGTTNFSSSTGNDGTFGGARIIL